MKQVFTIIPGTNAPLWMALGLAILMIALAALFIYLAMATRNVSFEVSGEKLKITGDLYGRAIPISTLKLEEMRAMNLKHEHEYRPRWRTNGVGMPGYLSGWFKLRNGNKALLFVTDQSRVVYIPTLNGYTLIVSTQRPDAFMDALRASAPWLEPI
jgi:hypothetical protein